MNAIENTIENKQALEQFLGRNRTRRPAPASKDLTVEVGGFTVPVDAGVEAGDCLPMPDSYRFPTKGAAAKATERVLMALVSGRNCFVHGMPGTGKDAVMHAFSSMTRKPTVMVTFRPGTDISPWFYSRSFSNDGGTGWKFGALWEALTQGVMGRDGVRRAALVLLSDVDRADASQAEWFRILTDSISGRILGPDGKMVPILSGTQFVCTANSCGTGDARGRMTSANVIDASIMDRLGRAVEFTYLHWDDESAVLREKFPLLVEKAPSIFDQLQGCCEALRKAIKDEEIFAEFTHRGICEVLAEAEDRVRFGKNKDLLSNAFDAWLDRLDADNRLAAKRMIDPHVSGGSV